MDKCPKCGNAIIYIGLDEIECASTDVQCPNGGVVDWKEKLKQAIKGARDPQLSEKPRGSNPYPSVRTLAKLRKAVNEKRAEQEGEDFDPQRSMSALGRALDPQARRTELVKEFIRIVMSSELNKEY